VQQAVRLFFSGDEAEFAPAARILDRFENSCSRTLQGAGPENWWVVDESREKRSASATISGEYPRARSVSSSCYGHFGSLSPQEPAPGALITPLLHTPALELLRPPTILYTHEERMVRDTLALSWFTSAGCMPFRSGQALGAVGTFFPALKLVPRFRRASVLLGPHAPPGYGLRLGISPSAYAPGLFQGAFERRPDSAILPRFLLGVQSSPRDVSDLCVLSTSRKQRYLRRCRRDAGIALLRP